MHTVTSKDGKAIAYEVAGGGPAVVLVGTTAGDHHDLDDLARLLAATTPSGWAGWRPRAAATRPSRSS